MKNILVTFIFITSFTLAQPNDSNFWELTNGPYGQKITTIDVLNNDSILVGTAGAGLFLYTKSDSNWQNIYYDASYNSIYSLLVTETKDILMSVNSSTGAYIVKVKNDFSSWSFVTDLPIGKFAIVNDSTNNFIMYITLWNGIFNSIDNGNTWIPMDVAGDIYGYALKDVKYDSNLSRIIIAANGTIWDNALNKTNNIECGILFSDDLGQTYYNVLEGYFDNVLINEKGIILAISDFLYRSFNNGLQWEEIQLPTFLDIILVRDSILFSVDEDGIYLSSDYGTTWEIINSDIKDLLTISAIDDSTFYIGSTDGFFHYSTTTNQYANLTNGLYASNIWSLFVAKNNTIFAGGKNGTIYYSEDFGTNWNLSYQLETDRFIENINTFTETSNGRLFVGTDLPFFYYTDNIQQNWERIYILMMHQKSGLWKLIARMKYMLVQVMKE